MIVERRNGVRRREVRLKQKQPIQNDVMERKDLDQP